jgi:hypothetical protein
LRPLSLRIMSRQDLTMLPSCCAVDLGVSFFSVADLAMCILLGCVKQLLQFADCRAELFRSTKELANLNDVAVLG